MNPLHQLVFAGLFFVVGFCRGVLLSLLPLEAVKLLGDAQGVSILYFGASIAGMLSSLFVPLLIRLGGSYRAFLVGAAAMALSALALGHSTTSVFVIGMALHVFAVATLEVTLNLYVLHRIARRELLPFEPKRVFFNVLALAIGPWLGVYLEDQLHHWAPFGLTVAAAAGAVIYFRCLGLHRDRFRESRAGSGNPLRNVGRFFSQPRLKLAWWLTVARSAWWTVFIIYTPIYAERSAQGPLLGAAVVSIGTAWTLTLPLWAWVARTYGVRRLLVAGYTANAAAMLLVFVFSANAEAVMALLVVAALGATMLDGAGNLLFMRAVRPFERAEMTGVFLTSRDASQLAPPGVFAVLLELFALPVVFIGTAAWMLVAAGYCRYIPKRM